MNNEKRSEILAGLMKEDLVLAHRKGHDYAGNKDSLANLRLFGFMGIVVRLGDKFMRLKSFIDQGELQVIDETIKDTLRDMRIYAYLAEILLDEESNTLDTENKSSEAGDSG